MSRNIQNHLMGFALKESLSSSEQSFSEKQTETGRDNSQKKISGLTQFGTSVSSVISSQILKPSSQRTGLFSSDQKWVDPLFFAERIQKLGSDAKSITLNNSVSENSSCPLISYQTLIFEAELLLSDLRSSRAMGFLEKSRVDGFSDQQVEKVLRIKIEVLEKFTTSSSDSQLLQKARQELQDLLDGRYSKAILTLKDQILQVETLEVKNPDSARWILENLASAVELIENAPHLSLETLALLARFYRLCSRQPDVIAVKSKAEATHLFEYYQDKIELEFDLMAQAVASDLQRLYGQIKDPFPSLPLGELQVLTDRIHELSEAVFHPELSSAKATAVVSKAKTLFCLLKEVEDELKKHESPFDSNSSDSHSQSQASRKEILKIFLIDHYGTLIQRLARVRAQVHDPEEPLKSDPSQDLLREVGSHFEKLVCQGSEIPSGSGVLNQLLSQIDAGDLRHVNSFSAVGIQKYLESRDQLEALQKKISITDDPVLKRREILRFIQESHHLHQTENLNASIALYRESLLGSGYQERIRGLRDLLGVVRGKDGGAETELQKDLQEMVHVRWKDLSKLEYPSTDGVEETLLLKEFLDSPDFIPSEKNADLAQELNKKLEDFRKTLRHRITSHSSSHILQSTPLEDYQRAILLLKLDRVLLTHDLIEAGEEDLKKKELGNQLLKDLSFAKKNLRRLDSQALKDRLASHITYFDLLKSFKPLAEKESSPISVSQFEKLQNEMALKMPELFAEALAPIQAEQGLSLEECHWFLKNLKDRFSSALLFQQMSWIESLSESGIQEMALQAISAKRMIDAVDSSAEFHPQGLGRCQKAAQVFSQLGFPDEMERALQFVKSLANNPRFAITDRMELWLTLAQQHDAFAKAHPYLASHVSAQKDLEEVRQLSKTFGSSSSEISSDNLLKIREMGELAHGLQYFYSGQMDLAEQVFVRISRNETAQIYLIGIRASDENAQVARRIALLKAWFAGYSRKFEKMALGFGENSSGMVQAKALSVKGEMLIVQIEQFMHAGEELKPAIEKALKSASVIPEIKVAFESFLKMKSEYLLSSSSLFDIGHRALISGIDRLEAKLNGSDHSRIDPHLIDKISNQKLSAHEFAHLSLELARHLIQKEKSQEGSQKIAQSLIDQGVEAKAAKEFLSEVHEVFRQSHEMRQWLLNLTIVGAENWKTALHSAVLELTPFAAGHLGSLAAKGIVATVRGTQALKTLEAVSTARALWMAQQAGIKSAQAARFSNAFGAQVRNLALWSFETGMNAAAFTGAQLALSHQEFSFKRYSQSWLKMYLDLVINRMLGPLGLHHLGWVGQRLNGVAGFLLGDLIHENLTGLKAKEHLNFTDRLVGAIQGDIKCWVSGVCLNYASLGAFHKAEARLEALRYENLHLKSLDRLGFNGRRDWFFRLTPETQRALEVLQHYHFRYEIDPSHLEDRLQAITAEGLDRLVEAASGQGAHEGLRAVILEFRLHHLDIDDRLCSGIRWENQVSADPHRTRPEQDENHPLVNQVVRAQQWLRQLRSSLPVFNTLGSEALAVQSTSLLRLALLRASEVDLPSFHAEQWGSLNHALSNLMKEVEPRWVASLLEKVFSYGSLNEATAGIFERMARVLSGGQLKMGEDAWGRIFRNPALTAELDQLLLNIFEMVQRSPDATQSDLFIRSYLVSWMQGQISRQKNLRKLHAASDEAVSEIGEEFPSGDLFTKHAEAFPSSPARVTQNSAVASSSDALSKSLSRNLSLRANRHAKAALAMAAAVVAGLLPQGVHAATDASFAFKAEASQVIDFLNPLLSQAQSLAENFASMTPAQSALGAVAVLSAGAVGLFRSSSFRNMATPVLKGSRTFLSKVSRVSKAVHLRLMFLSLGWVAVPAEGEGSSPKRIATESAQALRKKSDEVRTISSHYADYLLIEACRLELIQKHPELEENNLEVALQNTRNKIIKISSDVSELLASRRKSPSNQTYDAFLNECSLKLRALEIHFIRLKTLDETSRQNPQKIYDAERIDALRQAWRGHRSGVQEHFARMEALKHKVVNCEEVAHELPFPFHLQSLSEAILGDRRIGETEDCYRDRIQENVSRLQSLAEEYHHAGQMAEGLYLKVSAREMGLHIEDLMIDVSNPDFTSILKAARIPTQNGKLILFYAQPNPTLEELRQAFHRVLDLETILKSKGVDKHHDLIRQLVGCKHALHLSIWRRNHLMSLFMNLGGASVNSWSQTLEAHREAVPFVPSLIQSQSARAMAEYFLKRSAYDARQAAIRKTRDLLPTDVICLNNYDLCRVIEDQFPSLPSSQRIPPPSSNPGLNSHAYPMIPLAVSMAHAWFNGMGGFHLSPGVFLPTLVVSAASLIFALSPWLRKKVHHEMAIFKEHATGVVERMRVGTRNVIQPALAGELLEGDIHWMASDIRGGGLGRHGTNKYDLKIADLGMKDWSQILPKAGVEYVSELGELTWESLWNKLAPVLSESSSSSASAEASCHGRITVQLAKLGLHLKGEEADLYEHARIPKANISKSFDQELNVSGDQLVKFFKLVRSYPSPSAPSVLSPEALRACVRVVRLYDCKGSPDLLKLAIFRIVRTDYFRKVWETNGVVQICNPPSERFRLFKVTANAVQSEHLYGFMFRKKGSSERGIFIKSEEEFLECDIPEVFIHAIARQLDRNLLTDEEKLQVRGFIPILPFYTPILSHRTSSADPSKPVGEPTHPMTVRDATPEIISAEREGLTIYSDVSVPPLACTLSREVGELKEGGWGVGVILTLVAVTLRKRKSNTSEKPRMLGLRLNNGPVFSPADKSKQDIQKAREERNQYRESLLKRFQEIRERNLPPNSPLLTAAKNDLARAYSPLVWGYARRRVARFNEPADMFQAGMLGVAEAIETYDSQGPYAFEQHLRYHVKLRLREETKKGFSRVAYADVNSLIPDWIKLSKISQALHHEGVTAKPEILAERSGLSLDRVREVGWMHRAADVASLDASETSMSPERDFVLESLFEEFIKKYGKHFGDLDYAAFASLAHEILNPDLREREIEEVNSALYKSLAVSQQRFSQVRARAMVWLFKYMGVEVPEDFHKKAEEGRVGRLIQRHGSLRDIRVGPESQTKTVFRSGYDEPVEGSNVRYGAYFQSNEDSKVKVANHHAGETKGKVDTSVSATALEYIEPTIVGKANPDFNPLQKFLGYYRLGENTAILRKLTGEELLEERSFSTSVDGVTVKVSFFNARDGKIYLVRTSSHLYHDSADSIFSRLIQAFDKVESIEPDASYVIYFEGKINTSQGLFKKPKEFARTFCLRHGGKRFVLAFPDRSPEYLIGSPCPTFPSSKEPESG